MFVIQRASLEKAHKLLASGNPRKQFEYLAEEQPILMKFHAMRSKTRGGPNIGIMYFVIVAIAVERESGTNIPTVTEDMVKATIEEYDVDPVEISRSWELHYALVQPFLVPFIETVTFPHMGGAPPTPDLRLGALQDAFLMLRPFEK